MQKLAMNSLLSYVDEYFKKHGILEKHFKNFKYRTNQHKMAIDIATILESDGIGIIEAGTGIGKTFAYLIPAILSDKKVVIATKSKNLQEQLFFKDIESLKSIIPFPIRAVYIKGRNNYICLNKLSKASISNVFFKEKTVDNLMNWVKNSKFGDISEINENLNASEIFSVTSNSDTCAGSKCNFFKDCFIYKLKLEAEKSNIIIVNYHLLFADFIVKNQGFGRVLPEYRYLICDEAHSIEEIATEYFGKNISKFQLNNLIKEFEVNKFSDYIKLKNSIDEFFLIIDSKLKENSKVNFDEIINEEIEKKGDILLSHLIEVRKNLKNSEKDDLKVLAEKISGFIEIIDEIIFKKDELNIKWVERTKKNTLLKCYPIDVAIDLGNFFYNLKGTVFTSATLSINNSFEYFKTRVGIEYCNFEKIYPSTFDFKKQALLFVPEKIDEPNSEKFIYDFCNKVGQLIEITKGNAFILFTNLKNMNKAAELLRDKIEYPIFVQGETSNLHMINQFKSIKNSILLGSFSFWEGIDIPGENLSLVVIEKLPFAVPSDPLKKARINKIKNENGNPFFEYQVPEAIMLLKQGIGRLIRSDKDKGLVAIFDIRLLKKPYGKMFLKNLPKMKILYEINQLKQEFEKIKNN